MSGSDELAGWRRFDRGEDDPDGDDLPFDDDTTCFGGAAARLLATIHPGHLREEAREILATSLASGETELERLGRLISFVSCISDFPRNRSPEYEPTSILRLWGERCLQLIEQHGFSQAHVAGLAADALTEARKGVERTNADFADLAPDRDWTHRGADFPDTKVGPDLIKKLIRRTKKERAADRIRVGDAPR